MEEAIIGGLVLTTLDVASLFRVVRRCLRGTSFLRRWLSGALADMMILLIDLKAVLISLVWTVLMWLAGL